MVAVSTATNLKELLNDLVRVEGINAALVVSRDGFVIEGAHSSSDLDMESVGAVISAGVGAAEVMGSELGVGTIGQSMVEFERGIIVVSFLGQAGMLAIVADLKANLGNVRYQLKKRMTAIEAAL